MSEAWRGWEAQTKQGDGVEGNITSSGSHSHGGNVFPIFPSVQLDVGEQNAKSPLGVTPRDLISPLQGLADVIIIVLLGCVVGVPFGGLDRFATVNAPGSLWTGLAIAVITLLIDRAGGQSRAPGVTTYSGRFRQAVKSWTFGLGAFLFFEFIFRTSGEMSRAFLVSYFVVGSMAFGFWRAFAAPVIAAAGRRFANSDGDVVVLGDISRNGVREFLKGLEEAECRALLIPLQLDCPDAEWAMQQQRLIFEASRALREAKDAALYLCSAGLPQARLEALCRALSILPVATYVVPALATAGLAGCRASVIGNRVAFELRRAPLGRLEQFCKRAMDIVLGMIALVLLSPVMLAAAFAIKLDSRGPVFFRQLRTGKNGVQFRIFKFRTMNVLEDGATIRQAKRNDPRVTRVGRFLRASSVDELPQLFNVLIGEMSLVGPRPHAVAHDQLYSKQIPNYELRQHVKPGITGWAQAKGYRGETSSIDLMRRRVELDIWYALNASLLLDFEILARTVFELCRPRNAY